MSTSVEDIVSSDIALPGFRWDTRASPIGLFDGKFRFIPEWFKEFKRRLLTSGFEEVRNGQYTFMYEKVYEKYVIEIYPTMPYLPDFPSQYTVKIVFISDYERESTVLPQELFVTFSWEKYKKSLSALDSRVAATQEYRLWGNPESLRRDVAEAIYAFPIPFLSSQIEDILDSFETLHKQIGNNVEPVIKEKIFYTGPLVSLGAPLGLIWKVTIAPSYIGYYSNGVYYNLVSAGMASLDLGQID
jgi:hypothetical protein